MEEDPEKEPLEPYFKSGQDNKHLNVSFADPYQDQEIFDQWEDYIGVWKCDGLKLLVLPRKKRRINQEDFSSLSIYILETDQFQDGVFWFPESHKSDKKGLFFFEDYKKIRSKPVWLSKHASNLILRMSKTGNIFKLKKQNQHINFSLLSKVAVMGKAGLSMIKELENTIDAFTYSWAFGSSAIEVDLCTPTLADGSFDFCDFRISSEKKLRQNSQSLEQDSIAFEDFLTQVKDYYQEDIYIDLESFPSMEKEDQESLIENLLSTISKHIAELENVRFTINAPDDTFAHNIFDTTFWEEQLKRFDLEESVSWSAVWSEQQPRNLILASTPGRVASGKRVIEDALGKGGLLAPSIISINIEGIEGISTSLWRRIKNNFNKNFSPELIRDLHQDILFYTIDHNLKNVNLLVQLLYEIDFYGDMKRVLGFVTKKPQELIKHLALNCHFTHKEEELEEEY